MKTFRYNLATQIKLGSSSLDNNLKAIQEFQSYLANSKSLTFEGLLSNRDYQKIKRVCSKELNTLHNIRVNLLRSKAAKFREDYKEKCRLSKITLSHKNKLVENALSKLSKEEREVLKEYSFKL